MGSAIFRPADLAPATTFASAQQADDDTSAPAKKGKAKSAEPSPARAPTELRSSPLPAATGSSELVLIVNAEPDVDQDSIQRRVSIAAKLVLEAKGKMRDTTDFPQRTHPGRTLEREAFETLARFIVDGRLPPSGSDPRDAGLERDRDAWTLKLGGPYVLDELIVDYRHEPDEFYRKFSIVQAGIAGGQSDLSGRLPDRGHRQGERPDPDRLHHQTF